MSNFPLPPEVAVDRREETVVTQQPGYVASQQVIHDVASERRLMIFQVTRIIWTMLGILQIALAMRFFLKVIGANPDSGFPMVIYGLTAPFVVPFEGMIAQWTAGNMIFEVTTLIAMMVYTLIVWGIVSMIPIVTDRPSARTVTRTTQEQTPGASGVSGANGVERTTHTTTSD